MPLFSIIIPLFNKEDHIDTTLKSALNQTFTDFEILIVNDGSTDKSEEKVSDFKDDRIQYFSKMNEGVSATRNFGISKASGKYIAFLDADDLWRLDFLQNMSLLILQFPDEKVFSSAIEVEIDGKIFEASYSIPKNEKPQLIDFFEGSSNQTALFTSSAVFKKSVFNQVGNFDTNLKTGEDIDLWIRIGLQHKVVFSWKIGARYCEAKNSLSKNNIDYAEKSDFLKYSKLESNNENLRKYLDLNRFSLALKAKMANQNLQFHRFKKLIDLKNLSWKQKIVLQLPASLLQLSYRLKTFLHKRNIRLSVFK